MALKGSITCPHSPKRKNFVKIKRRLQIIIYINITNYSLTVEHLPFIIGAHGRGDTIPVTFWSVISIAGVALLVRIRVPITEEVRSYKIQSNTSNTVTDW